MDNYFASVYAITGQEIKVKCPPTSETTLLFANRYRFSNKSLTDIFIRSDQTNSKKEKLLTFGNDEKDTANINLTIKSNTTLYFTIQGQDCGVRLLFKTKSTQPIQCTIPLTQTLSSNQISDFSKKILPELEKAFKSNDSLLIMLLIFEKYFSTYFFLQKKEEFPALIQNIFHTSIKRLSYSPIDNLYKLISFISFKLSLEYHLTEAAAIIFISIIKDILINDSSNNTINEIINQFYDTQNFLVFQSLLINIKPNIIDQSLLLPVPFFANKNIDAILVLYNYVVSNKTKIHYTYLNLFSLVASEDELKLVFNQNQIYDPENYIIEKSDKLQYQLINTKISKSTIYEKKEIKDSPINFKPKKLNQPLLQRPSEEKATIKPNPSLSVSSIFTSNFPYNETALTITQNSPCSICPKNNLLNFTFKVTDFSIQPSKEIKQSGQTKERKESQQHKQKKQDKIARQKKAPTNNRSSKENEETKRVAKSKSMKEPFRNLVLFFIFSIIVIISIILLLCQYFFI